MASSLDVGKVLFSHYFFRLVGAISVPFARFSYFPLSIDLLSRLVSMVSRSLL